MDFCKKSKENERKAIVRVLEIDNDGSFEKDELGFGVKIKKHKERDEHFFITSSSVLKSPLSVPAGSKIVADRYCSKYPNHIDNEDHRREVVEVKMSNDGAINFAFCKGGREEEFLEIADDSFHEKYILYGSVLSAYVFDGKDIVLLQFKDEYNSNDYKLKTIGKKGFQTKRAKGAPIIYCDPLSDVPKVVGIVGIKSDGTLYPVFVKEENLCVRFDSKKPPGEQDEPIGKNGKPDVNKTGETFIDEIDSSINERSGVPVDDGKNGRPIQTTGSDVPPTKGVNNLVVTGLQATVKKPERSLSKDKSKCIKYIPICEAPKFDKQIRKLQIKLDPERPFGGDISSLADAFDYSAEEITFLKNLPFPTQKLLQEQGNCTIIEIRRKLDGIGRDDAVKLLDDYIESQACNCEECASLC